MSDASTLGLVDFGSTFTKVRAVDPEGRIIALAEHRTTVEDDVMDGLESALAELAEQGVELDAEQVLACSSAGGGLRMVVAGLVEDLTAEAAKQAALGAGARILGVLSGHLDAEAAERLMAQDPDIVLLVGGTDGGDRECMLAGASALAAAVGEVPVVLAGNVEAQPEAERILGAAGAHVVRAPNVMPQVGELAPEPTRTVLRGLFISHVIAGKLGGSASTLEKLVRMATPDAALKGVEVLAAVLEGQGMDGGVIVVDIGGATTDVHSWAEEREPHGYKRPLLPQASAARTVEGDLGMRWSAPGILEAALEEGMVDAERLAELEPAAARRAGDPGFLANGPLELDRDHELAQTAIAIALRRHAGTRRIQLQPEGAVLSHDGRDLSGVAVLIGTGGVLRNMDAFELEASLELAGRGREDRLLPRGVRTGVDRRGVLAAAGLLSEIDPQAARALLAAEVESFFAPAPNIDKEEEDVNVAP